MNVLFSQIDSNVSNTLSIYAFFVLSFIAGAVLKLLVLDPFRGAASGGRFRQGLSAITPLFTEFVKVATSPFRREKNIKSCTVELL